MKTATQLHLQRLVRLHGSYSQTARALGLDIRNLRRNRSDMKPPTRRVLTIAGRHLMLRLLLRELIRSGVVTPAQLQRAWANIPQIKDPSI